MSSLSKANSSKQDQDDQMDLGKQKPATAESASISGYGWMKGSAIELGDIVVPIGEPWDAADE